MPALSTGSPGLRRPRGFGPPGPAAPTGFAAAAAAGVRRFPFPPRAPAAAAPSVSPSGPEKLNLGSSRTGGPAGTATLISNGALTTRSRDAFSSPPNADQTSEIDRSCGGRTAMLRVVGQRAP